MCLFFMGDDSLGGVDYVALDFMRMGSNYTLPLDSGLPTSCLVSRFLGKKAVEYLELIEEEKVVVGDSELARIGDALL